MRHSSSVTRPAPRRTAILGLLATFAGFALLPCGVAAASITLFEPPLYHPASVNGQRASAPAPGRALPLGRSTVSVGRSKPLHSQRTPDSTTRRSSPGGHLALLLASLLGSAVNRCVCRTHVRPVSSPTRRIPHRSHNRSASSGPIRCSSPSSRLCPRPAPTSLGCS